MKKSLLKEYQIKRKFDKTPEPKGKPERSSGKLKFVVHKHAASHAHYDLRLEMDGVYKSWAVPKGPSLNPSDQRLAMFVEDHPIEYGKFEGIIPEGNYGAGTVMLWDRGTYESRATSDRKKGEAALLKGLAEGHITFVMNGEKLKGEFALIRLKRGGPKAWLLVKKRDSYSSTRAVFQEQSVKTGRTMPEIAAEAKKAGAIWESKKVKPVKLEKTLPSKKGALPERAEKGFPHRVKLTQAVLTIKGPESGEWIFSPSFNGVRAIAELEKRQVRIYSKAFLPLEKKYPAVVKALGALSDGLVLDGELYNGKFLVSDLIYAKGKDLREKNALERARALADLKIPSEVGVLHGFEKEALAVKEAEKLGAEFIVAKERESKYEGGLSRKWHKYRVGAGQSEPENATPPLTHLDKIYFPEDKFTKGDLIAYYDSISELILPHMIDRPQSMHRQPDGIKNFGFFHKDVTGFIPRRVKTMKHSSGSSGKTINYLLCQDRWTLLYMVNLGCIEFNPWLSRIPHLDRPDFSIIDLDPSDDNTFEEVIEVAQEVQKVLKTIEVDSFVKTSGATGLHICVPTGGKYDYDATKDFAEGVCKVVLDRTSSFTSMERSPAKRRGKIYLDFLQNRRSQTLAAPYCVRPYPGAPVSTPLHWKEVKKGLDPRDFTIRNIRARVKKVGDLWLPLINSKADLAKAIGRLSRMA